MEVSTIISKYKRARYNFFKWRYESSFAHKVVLALVMACLTGIGAQIRIYLPFTPVPITLQVFFALLSGILLGKWYGGLSQALYAGIGGAGVPWFAPKVGMQIFSSGGISILKGVTGGYIIGFVIAAIIIGWFVDRYTKARSIFPQLLLMMLGVGIIYALGALQLSLILHIGFQRTLELGVLPFIPVDIVKAIAVAIISTAMLPKEAYNGEVDVRNRKN
ncbi:MAG: biotin transporter BioY [Euryarchaeota archaeon]|nr:biotin transporter BioY [Euryarchaeota archaeon]